MDRNAPTRGDARPRRLRALVAPTLLGAFATWLAVGCTKSRPAGGDGDAAAETSGDASLGDASLGDGSPDARASLEKPETVACAGKDVVLFVSPRTPVRGKPVRVLAVSEKKLRGTLELRDASGTVVTDTKDRHGETPYFYRLEATSTEGALTARFVDGTCKGTPSEKTVNLTLAASAPPGPRSTETAVWTATREWDPDLENVYSAWIETLFDAAEGESLSYAALHEVLRDPKRNFLFDHLGAHEDSDRAPVIRPDCADLPYALRAIFAWKLGLPFGMAECGRGGGGAPPDCSGLVTQGDPPAKPRPGAADQFGTFVRGTLADRVHSGSARTPFTEDESDYYPVELTWEALRPGTVFADPYGHVLVIAKRLPETSERGGVLYAVDGQPDGTVGRKRFWRGNFLFAKDVALGGPGWKRFRPLTWNARTSVATRVPDARIAKDPRYHFSLAQAELDADGFYDAMDDVLAPTPRDPEVALLEVVTALDEQVRTRVTSVENGRKFLEKKGPPAPMPEGPQIFETQGPWEDFSTPSRDLRLLIAIDVVSGFPAKVARRTNRYAMPKGQTPETVKASLEARLAKELSSRKVQYTRTDGSPFELTLAEVVARSAAFETAYDPNDCVELRWGATAGTPEAETCVAHAPKEQRARMESVRGWFRDRKRPPR
jgi:hypothetical protein